jgi:hypothetical protein
MQSPFILLTTTSKRRNVSAFLCCLTLTATLVHNMNGAINGPAAVRAIMKRSLEAGDRNAVQLHGYVSTKHVEEKQLEIDGSVRSQTVKTFDFVLVDGILIRKLIEKDGKPLSPPEARKEDERVKRIATARQQETSSEKAQRVIEEEKKKVKAHEFSREILDAFDFRLLGEEEINGRKNWLIEATPIPGYKPKELRAQIFPHLTGRIWIDQKEYLWTKAEATASDPFTIGFGIIAKLEQGAHLYFDQTRLPDGVWLLRDSGVRAVAHVAIVKRIGIEQVSTFENFRKALAGVQVVEDSTGN